MTGILVMAEVRAQCAAIAADLELGRAALGAMPGGLNLARGASYLRATMQELDAAAAKGAKAIEVAK